MHRWTEAETQSAIRVLRQHSKNDLTGALQSISRKLGFDVQYDTLRGAFRRQGLSKPSDFCREQKAAKKPSEAQGSRLERLLLVPDAHHPYQSEVAWDVMMAAARRFRPDRIIILGDFVDFYSVMSHAKDPGRSVSLPQELASAIEGLKQLGSLGAKHKYYVEGNHEDRLPRYLAAKCPELHSMLNAPALLKLKELGWSYTPYRQFVKIGHLHITHDTGSAGPDAHIRARSDFEGCVVIGHTHRMATHYSGNAKGEVHVGASFGWLGDPDAIDYMTNIRIKRSWTHGFGIGYLEPKSGVVHLQAVPIIHGKCVVNGELISLKSHSEAA